MEEAGKRTLAALERRTALLADRATTCCRLVNAAADGIDGFVLERFGDVLVAQLHEGRLAVNEGQARALCETAMQRTQTTCVYRKFFPRDRSHAAAMDAQNQSPHPWIGNAAPEEFEVVEAGVNYLIRPFDGYSVGLFLENRANRRLVREIAKGADILNCFAYTCGFAVCAAMGRAASTVNVDVSKKYLEWGKRNFTANGLSLDNHWFIASDVLEYYRRAERQEKSFDLIILDAPTFGRAKESGRVFSLKEHLGELIFGAMKLLRIGGQILLSVNHRPTSIARMESAIEEASSGRNFYFEDVPPLPVDFEGDEDFAKTVLVRA
ncbi:MAG: class I SAM-dependent rRNA methyltransferase [Phycisphaerae bacterium]